MRGRDLPDGPLTLADVTVPAALIGRSGDLVRTDLHVAGGRLVEGPQARRAEMAGAMVWPCFTDMHTHLDKGHIWPRAANPDGTFTGALEAVRADREAHWTAQDVAARMDFSLRCAFAHGTARVRTHLDSAPPQDAVSWPVFADMRARWAGRVELQAVCLVGVDLVAAEGLFLRTADLVAEHGGLLGMATHPVPDLAERIRGFLEVAGARGLAVDLHVDESLDPGDEALRQLARAVLDTGFDAPVTVGHCCSLTAQDEARALSTLDLVARAGIAVVGLPMCNLYLQDRGPGTPRRRGVTLVHEMAERGIPVAFASDNTRDPFYAYGDLDMLEVMREATRIAHLDHRARDWTHAFTTAPARACGWGGGDLSPGAPADLVICSARSWSEFFARPQSDRIVLRGGRAIDRTLPHHAELDHLFEAAPTEEPA